MKRAVQNIIRHFYAKECQEGKQRAHPRDVRRVRYLVANFELCIAQGLL